MMNLPKFVNHDIQPVRNKTELGCDNSRHYASSTKLLKEVNIKTARMKDLLKVRNYDKKRNAAYFHSKQVFPAPKQTKGANIADAQNTKLFHQNHE